MEIVIIGTGNTATVLGKKLKRAGHRIVQVFGRDAIAASKLAYELQTESATYWSVIYKNADIYLLAVSDIAVEEIIAELQLPHKTIVHTAASVSKYVLQNASEHFGVFYPLQSLKKESDYLPDIPIIIDASDDSTLQDLSILANSISERVVQADDITRTKFHLAAVFCNNFVNHLYTLAAAYCQKEGLDFSLLLPLIQETAQRVQTLPPEAAQTGPAVRHDRATIEKHMALLASYPHLKHIYEELTESLATFK